MCHQRPDRKQDEKKKKHSYPPTNALHHRGYRDEQTGAANRVLLEKGGQGNGTRKTPIGKKGGGASLRPLKHLEKNQTSWSRLRFWAELLSWNWPVDWIGVISFSNHLSARSRDAWSQLLLKGTEFVTLPRPRVACLPQWNVQILLVRVLSHRLSEMPQQKLVNQACPITVLWRTSRQ